MKQVYEMFTNPEDLYYHTQRTRYYISRYGYSTNIYEFELLSEPYHINEFWIEGSEAAKPINDPNNPERQLLRDAMLSYNSTISSYIKNNSNQLVGINYSGPEWLPSVQLENDTVSKLTTIDIIGMNLYANEPNKLIISKDDNSENNELASEENSYYARVKAFHDKYGKPVLFPEFGINEDLHKCSGFTGHYVDVMTAGFTGVAGFNMWDGFMHPTPTEPYEEEILWPSTIRVQQHMNADDVINTLKNIGGAWIQGRVKRSIYNSESHVDAKEVQYYISTNKERAVGYVKNRTYNIHTKRINDNCVLDFGGDNVPIDNLTNIEWNDGPNLLWVDELKKNTDYRVDWYDFKTGNYIFSECQNTQNKKFKLKFPELMVNDAVTDRPIVWFVIQQENCQKNDSFSADISDTLNVHSTRNLNVNEDNHELFTVYPNPSDGYINVLVSNIHELELYNIQGVLVLRQNLKIGINVIDTKELVSGVYYIKLKDSSNRLKLVIQ